MPHRIAQPMLPYIAAGAVLCTGLTASFQLALLAQERERSEQQGKVVAELAVVRARLEGLLKGTFNSTQGIAHLVSLRGQIPADLFNQLSRMAINDNPHVRNITLAPNDQVSMVYPLSGNEKVLGYRLTRNPEQMVTIDRARERRTPLLAGPVKLVQGGEGLIHRHPVFSEHLRSPGESAPYWGTVSIVARVDTLLRDAGISERHPSLHIALRGRDGLGERGALISGAPDLFAANPILMNVEVPGGNWQLAAIPHGGWSDRPVYASTYFQLGAINSLLLALIMGQLLLNNQRTRQRNADLMVEMEERRNIEATLRAREEDLRLAAMVFDSTSEGVMITNPQGFILSTNRAFTTITGYTEDEVRGSKPNVLRSERQSRDFYQTMWASLTSAGAWQGEIWNRRKNGELFPEWLSISAVRNTEGDTTHYVAVFSDISTIKHSQIELEHLAHFDPLTDLPNRILFQDRLNHAIERSRHHEQTTAVLLLDLDGFKMVNDTMGHPVGDLLLQQVAHRLVGCIQAEDTVSRLGGDEFALILPDSGDGSMVVEVVSRILNSVARPFMLNGLTASVTASIGIAIYPSDGQTVTELVRNADVAMYSAKNAGRNAYCYYRSEMTLQAQKQLELEQALRQALERDEFEVWFQPQISLVSGAVTGAEALVRWRHPARGLVPPLDFIPLAEQTGLIVPLGEWVLRRVCLHAREWLDEGLNFGRLAINVSVPQFERGDFVLSVRETLQAHGLGPEHLEIEVTESSIMASASHGRAVLDGIQELGVTTAIDDFGTGYSSLSYLKELPIDNLKIDRSFIRNLPDDSNDIAITRAIIGMAHSLGFKVIAEGIESAAQQEFLTSEGCDEAQGYHISRPLPAEEFARWLTSYRPAGITHANYEI